MCLDALFSQILLSSSMWRVVIAIIILLILLILIPKENALVVLWSTGWREWESTVDNHIELINRLGGDPVLGIHYWSKMPIRGGTETTGDAPSYPPEQLNRWNYVHSTTEQSPELLSKIKTNLKEGGYGLGYIIESTKIALENAEIAYFRKFGRPMPDDTLILRLRPDIIIDVDKFPTEIPEGDNFYISNWNRVYRREWNPDMPEVGDIMCLTTKKVMRKIVNTRIEDIERICNPDQKLGFGEAYMYALLKVRNVDIINHPDIHTKMQRSKDEIEILS